MVTRREIEHIGSTGVANIGNVAYALGDFYLYLDPDDKSLTPCIRRDGYWEAWVTAWIYNNIVPGGTFFDVGANCGYYTMLASRRIGDDGIVMAFEPNVRYVQLLGRTLDINKADNALIIPVALGKERDEVDLKIPGDYHGSASTKFDFTGQYEQEIMRVPQHTLAEYMTSYHNPVMIKLDVEGAEEDVLDGAWDCLYNNGQVTIVMEYTPGAYSDDFLGKLRAFGSVHLLTTDGGDRPVSDEEIRSSEDWMTLIIRNEK